MLSLNVVDAVTGKHLESNTIVDLMLADGSWLERARGGANADPIAIENAPLQVALRLRLRQPGYLDASVGPLVIQPDTPLLLECELTPLFSVMINLPREAYKDVRLLRVFSSTPPAWPDTRPYSEWRDVHRDSTRFMLPPGRYWCQVAKHDPLKHPEFTDRANWLSAVWLSRTPGYALTTPSSLSEFEVTDGALSLATDLVWRNGNLRIGGRMLDSAGRPQRGVKILAVRCGPGPARELAASATTDVEGRFQLNGLNPGVYRVQVETPDPSHGEQSVWLGRLREGEPAPELTLTVSQRQQPEESDASPEKQEPEAHDRPIKGVNIKLPLPTPPPLPGPPPPREKILPPLPPRPPTFEAPPTGGEVWLYPTGAEVDELWSAVVHVSDGKLTWTTAVAERDELRVCLVLADGRLAIVVQGVPEGALSISLRLPDRDPVRVELQSEQSAYAVEFR